jgi:hypothetical protein
MSASDPVEPKRLDDLEEILVEVQALDTGDRWGVDIPVSISAQESADIAQSLFDGAFIVEKLTAALGNAQLDILADKLNPNQEIIRLSGIVAKPRELKAFFDEWTSTLAGEGEPFEASEEATELRDRFDTHSSVDAFRWPQLVQWYREARDG